MLWVTETVNSLMQCSCHFVLLEAEHLINANKCKITPYKYETVQMNVACVCVYLCVCVRALISVSSEVHRLLKCEQVTWFMVESVASGR